MTRGTDAKDPGRLDARVEELARRLVAVERRLAVLEAPEGEPRRGLEADAPEVASTPPGFFEGFTLALVGRTLVVLAGAFALRAITESGAMPQVAGTACGFVYAVVWLALCDRAAASGKRASAAFHGVAAAIIGFPLLWEATVRFGILPPEASAVALAFLAAVGLFVAHRRNLRRLAWTFTVGAVTAGAVLAVATRLLVPFASLLLLLGVVTLWLGYVRGWRGPGWFAAIVADLGIGLVTVTLLVGDPERVGQLLGAQSVMALQLALMVAYLVSLGARTLARGRQLHPSEIAQGLAVLAVGLGGAAAVTRSANLSAAPIGAIGLLLAVGCYGVSFAIMDRRGSGRVNFIFYTTLAWIFAVVGVGHLLAEPFESLTYSALALGSGWLGGRRGRATLSMHGAAYVVVAGWTSGLLAGAVAALSNPTVDADWVGVTAAVALIVAAVCCGLPVASHGRTWGSLARGTKLVMLVVLCVGSGGLAVSLLAPLVAAGADGRAEAGSLAALRTCVLSVAAVGLAALGRWPRLLEASWLVYPVLIAGALKLAVEDMRAGRALTLFVSLAFFGGALILAPRLKRREGPADAG